MAYLKWTGSPWHAFSHIDGGDGEDAVLAAWHERGARIAISEGELVREGCEGQPERLRAFIEDVGALGPAVDQFLFEICNAGKTAIPSEVANRYRDFKRCINEAANAPRRDRASDSLGYPLWFGWWTEMNEIIRRHPPPRESREIRDLMQARALRVLLGPAVSPAQDAFERAQIAATTEWPPL
jgi:hypothetical protein